MEKLKVFLFMLTAVFVNSEKRIVLHSTTDIAEEFLKLKAELETMKANMSTIANKISSLEDENVLLKMRKELSSVFVRWGRTVCPNATQMIYKGYTAGGYHGDQGGGANMLCLPDNPTWGKYSNGLDALRGYIYGAEIDIIEPSQSRIFDHVVNQQDQPCVVCSSNYAVTHMFPGRVNCYPGWVLQYTGYLMSNLHGRDLNLEYFCMDSDPEALPHGGTNDDQSIIYLVD